MEQLTTTSIVALFDTNKAQRESFVTDLLERIETGDVNALDVHLQVKCMEDIIARLTDSKKYTPTATRYRESLMHEVDKHPGKEFEYHRAKIKKSENGTKYDFSKCGDWQVELLAVQADAADKKLKERQEFLKSIPEEGLEQLNKETGEITTSYRPTKTSTSSITVTLK